MSFKSSPIPWCHLEKNLLVWQRIFIPCTAPPPLLAVRAQRDDRLSLSNAGVKWPLWRDVCLYSFIRLEAAIRVMLDFILILPKLWNVSQFRTLSWRNLSESSHRDGGTHKFLGFGDERWLPSCQCRLVSELKWGINDLWEFISC
jgi:hypothetical protein